MAPTSDCVSDSHLIGQAATSHARRGAGGTAAAGFLCFSALVFESHQTIKEFRCISEMSSLAWKNWFSGKSVFSNFSLRETALNMQKTPHFRAVFSVLHLSSTHSGACGRTRTGDLRITNALLYQLSHTSSYLLPERVFSRSQCSQYIMLLKVRQYFFEIFLDILRISVIMV